MQGDFGDGIETESDEGKFIPCSSCFRVKRGATTIPQMT